jgi:NAD(P)H-hydrate epimerase
MQTADRAAMRTFGIPGIVLMENAGRAFVDVLDHTAGPLVDRVVFVLCGKGKNGGDGFVIARHLAHRGARVHVILLGRKAEVRGESKVNLDSLLRLASHKENRIHFEAVSSVRPLSRHGKPDIVVDALLGTGFSGTVKGLYKKGIAWMNESKARVFSVDIPSGVEATSGTVSGAAVRAERTVTMGLGKTGLYVGEGREHAGPVSVVDIGVPSHMLVPRRDRVYLATRDDIGSMLPTRPLRSHKYSVGKVLVLAGSRNLTGAPFLCSQAAMKVGAGAVILLVPRSIHHLLARKLTEVMVHPLDETADGTVGLAAIDAVLEQCAWADVVVAGPGLSRNAETLDLLRRLIPAVDKPLVLDADGLAILAGSARLLRKRKASTVLTPHVGELSRITGQPGGAIEAGRLTYAREAASRFRAVTVLKGSPTVTAVPRGDTILNTTGNPGMATAGSGDVLSGVVGGLIAQGIPGDKAAWGGVFLHGAAGDLAARRFGQRGMLAHDICDHLSDALRQFEK